MEIDSNVQRARAAQVGFLMRSYREAFIREDGGRGLTQEELLQRMASVNSEYGERYSHATVSRWESGLTRPTVNRLRTFGKAINLSPEETDGLIVLAALSTGPNGSEPSGGNGRQQDYEESEPHAGEAPADVWASAPATQDQSTFVSGVVNFVLVKSLVIGASVVGCGYAMALLGWNPDWMPTAYMFVVVVIVMAQGFMLPTRDSNLSEFFFVSLFFLLTTPLLQFERLHLDHYGFYRIDGIAGTHVPYMLALLVNLMLATAAAVASKLLWKWHYSENQTQTQSSAIRRAAWTNLLPVAAVYVVVVVLSNVSVAIQIAVSLATLAALFTVMTALRDPSIRPSERDRQFLLSTLVTIGIVATTLGLAVVIAMYVSQGVPMVLPDHNLLSTWELDFQKIGLTREEAIAALNLGYLWHAICVFTYMVVIVGGNTLVAIYRMPVVAQRDGNAASVGSRA